MSIDQKPADTTSVRAVMNYLSPESTVLLRFTAPGASINTGTYEPHDVLVHDARPLRHGFTLEEHGFELRDIPSAVVDFTDRDELRRTYYPEVEAFVKERLGADEVALLGPTLRRSQTPEANDSQPAAALVHIDFSPEGAQEHTERTYAKHFPDGPGFSRAVSTSFWRVFSPPPQDWPLAVADFQSLDPSEGLPNTLHFVDELPKDPLAPVQGSKGTVSGSEFHYRPEHRWYFFPDMTRDEVLFFVLHDSDHSRAWRVMHSAFRDATVEATAPRHSVEFRTVAFFR